MSDEDLYELLGVKPEATAEELSRAWRAKAKENHPDRHEQADEAGKAIAQDRMRKLNAAYDVLKDPVKRAQYDNAKRVGSSGWNMEDLLKNAEYGGRAGGNLFNDDESLFGTLFADILNTEVRGKKQGRDLPKLHVPLRGLLKGGELSSTSGARYKVAAGTRVGTLIKGSDGREAAVEVKLPPGYGVSVDSKLFAQVMAWPSELISGSVRTLVHPDGEGTITVQIPTGSKPEALRFLVPKRGLPIGRGRRTDLIVEVHVRWPTPAEVRGDVKDKATQLSRELPPTGGAA